VRAFVIFRHIENMTPLYTIASRHRIAITRILVGAAFLLVIFSSPAWEPHPSLDAVMDLAAFVLVLVATFGRLWALSHIGSRKTRELVTHGPYSVTRNPLYLFSFIGALGIGIVSDRVVLVALVIMGFALYYPFVIKAEEVLLHRVHGEDFLVYKARVPRLLPRFSAYAEPPDYVVNSRAFRRSFLRVMWFPLPYVILLMAENLRETGVIPVLFTIP